MDAVTIFVAQYLVLLAPLALLQVLWTLPARERFHFVALTLLSLTLAYAAAKFGSFLYDNPRPFVVGAFEPLVPHGIENGFPSMHALFAATFAALVITKRPYVGTILLVVAFLIGTARALAGVHHAVDVLASLIIAPLSVALADRLLLLRVRR